MDDDRVWTFEESLWIGDAAHYAEAIDDACLMALPVPPHVFSGGQAIAAVQATPRWSAVTFSEQRVARPQEGLIVVAYTASATRDGAAGYEAHCTSTYRRLAHETWRVVQHQQTPRLVATGAPTD